MKQRKILTGLKYCLRFYRAKILIALLLFDAFCTEYLSQNKNKRAVSFIYK